MLKDARLKQGLTTEAVASCSGISVEEYEDVESYEDDLTDCISILSAFKVCRCLGLDLIELLGIPTRIGRGDSAIAFSRWLTESISDSQKALSEVSDGVNLDEETLTHLQSDQFAFSNLNLDMFLGISKFFGMPESTMLKCAEAELKAAGLI